MAALQQIFVVSTSATDDDLARLRKDLARDRVVLTAPTPEAKRVVQAIGVDPEPEMRLAPVRFPGVDRGQQLDTLVRNRALQDRFTDVVAVTDPASVVLLLRVMAPDQLADSGAVTRVGLPRSERPVALLRGAIIGVVLGVLAVLGQAVLPILVLPAAAAVAGLVLLALPVWRRIGLELLLAAVVGTAVMLLVIASSQRFPA